MEHFERGNVRLAFEILGVPGDPVALIHDGWDDHHAWDLVVPGLAGALDVLSYDRRGHGSSAGPPREHPVRADASDLALLLEGTDHYPAHLVGHGYGGAVALRLAVDRPELVRSVTLHEAPFVEVGGDPPPEGSAGPSLAERLAEVRALASCAHGEEAAIAFLALFGAPEEQWSALDVAWKRTLVANARAWAEEAGDPEACRPPLEELGAVAVPVLVLTGSRSPGAASWIDERLAAALPNATALTLPEGGHFVPRTDPDLFVGVLGTFLLERNVPST